MFNPFGSKSAKRRRATDRRAGAPIPHVGKQPRARTKNGNWRRKRSDADIKRGPRKLFGLF